MGSIYAILKDALSVAGRLLLRPRLRIAYEPTRSRDMLAVADAGGRLACFYHLVVRNAGRRVARECKGTLVSVEAENAVGTVGPRLAKPEVLKWANEATYAPVDIPRQEDRRLDLAFVFKGDNRLLFFFEPPAIPVGTTQAFPPGSYSVRVRVDADHTSAVVRLRVRHPGTWDAVEIEVLR